MAAIFSRWRLYGILVLKKKLKVQLKIAHLTRKNDKTIQNDERKYYFKSWTQGWRWALTPTPTHFKFGILCLSFVNLS